MKNKLFKLLCIIVILYCTNLLSVSMVYNFRIAQITKQFNLENEENNTTIIALLYDEFFKKSTGETQNFAGPFGTLIFKHESFYLRMDTAYAHITNKKDNLITYSGNQTDDILFTLGYNFYKKHHHLMTFSGLFGLPTHKIHALQHTDFGYAQNSFGLQFDGSYSYNQDRKNILLYGARYIRFIPRIANDINDTKYKFSTGNLVDLFIANKNTFGNHGLEYGYTLKFDFGAKVYPNFSNIIEKINYIRSNFYAVYKYNFKIKDIENKLFLNLGYGFDHVPKTFGNKYIITLWGAWNITF
ncbi:MAG: hypothetical protein P4L22_05615 [Candidatus Babeliales bacterium]|nr:hypothetical protein [Candidatus Babeliales bacterium]